MSDTTELCIRVTKIVAARLAKTASKTEYFDLKLTAWKDTHSASAALPSFEVLRDAISARVGHAVSFNQHDLVLLVANRDHLSGFRPGERKTELSKQKKQNQMHWKWHNLADTDDGQLRVVNTETEVLYITGLCGCGSLVTSEHSTAHPNHRYCRKHARESFVTGRCSLVPTTHAAPAPQVAQMAQMAEPLNAGARLSIDDATSDYFSDDSSGTHDTHAHTHTHRSSFDQQGFGQPAEAGLAVADSLDVGGQYFDQGFDQGLGGSTYMRHDNTNTNTSTNTGTALFSPNSACTM